MLDLLKKGNVNVPKTMLKLERVQGTGNYLNFHFTGVLLSKEFVKKKVQSSSFYKLYVLLPFTSNDDLKYPSYINPEDNMEIEIFSKLDFNTFPNSRAKFDCLLSKSVLKRLLEAKQVVIISVYGKDNATFLETIELLEVVNFRNINVKTDKLYKGWWLWTINERNNLGIRISAVDFESELGKFSSLSFSISFTKCFLYTFVKLSTGKAVCEAIYKLVKELNQKTAIKATTTTESEDQEFDDPLYQGVLTSPSKSNMFLYETDDNNEEYHNSLNSELKNGGHSKNSIFKRGLSFANVISILEIDNGDLMDSENFSVANINKAFFSFFTQTHSSQLEEQQPLPDPSKCILSSIESTEMSHIEVVKSFEEIVAILDGIALDTQKRIFFRITACLVDFQWFDETKWNSEFEKMQESSENNNNKPFMYIELDYLQPQRTPPTTQSTAWITVEKKLVESILGCTTEVAAAKKLDVTGSLNRFFNYYCPLTKSELKIEMEKAKKSLEKEGEWITTSVPIDEDKKQIFNPMVTTWIFEATQWRPKAKENSSAFSSSLANNFYFNRHLVDFNVNKEKPQWIFSLCSMYDKSASSFSV